MLRYKNLRFYPLTKFFQSFFAETTSCMNAQIKEIRFFAVYLIDFINQFNFKQQLFIFAI